MSSRSVKERLLARTGRGAVYGLERMQTALARLGHPERELQLIHVAGTNGKGSVTAMLEAAARAARLRTGMYTSPHLARLEERIRLDGEPIDEAAFATAVTTALDAGPELTFFESMTLAAFVAMREARITLGVLEVGLGGRLDATNVIGPPLAAAITSIGLDHTHILGADLVAIAGEKAGIVKPDTPVVVGAMATGPRDTIVEVARRVGAGPVTVVALDADDAQRLEAEAAVRVVRLETRPDRLVLRGAVELSVPTPLALAGAHQQENAAVAATTLASLRTRTPALSIPDAAIVEGLRGARWPGRLERLSHRGVDVLFDCAHNPHAVLALRGALADTDPTRTRLVFGAMDDKAWADMLPLLEPLASERHYCPPLRELAGRLPASPVALAARLPGVPHASPLAAFEAALATAGPGDTVLVTGSIFLVGALRAHVTGTPADDPIPL